MKLLFILICLSLSNSAVSQGYINLTKKKALEKLETIRANNKGVNIVISETDTTLLYLVRDSTMKSLDFILLFDQSGKCYKETNKLSCDSCYQILLSNVLSDKYYRWTKIDSNTYFARFPYRLILTTKLDQAFSFEIRRSELSGKEYRKTVKNAKSIDE